MRKTTGVENYQPMLITLLRSVNLTGVEIGAAACCRPQEFCTACIGNDVAEMT